MADDLPDLPSRLVGALGRPWWLEAMAFNERTELSLGPVPLGAAAGRRVVLVPGYLAGERSLEPLADWLASAGFMVVRAQVGRNMVTSTAAAEQIAAALHSGDGPSILIGHSRGGQQCRVAAYRNPELVSQLITLGAPVRAHYPRAAFLRASVEGLRLFSQLPFGPDDDPEGEAQYERDLFAPFPDAVPWTSIWSKRDGVVEWQACLDVGAESVEVACSHSGLIASVPSFRAIAQVLDRVRDETARK